MAMEKFHYTVPGTKKKIELPKFSSLPFGAIRKIRGASEEDQIFVMFEATADEKNLDVIDTLTIEEVGELVDAWQKDAGVDLGESAA